MDKMLYKLLKGNKLCRRVEISSIKFNLEEVQTDYIDHFCHLGSDGYRYLMNICNYLQSLQNIPLRKYVR